jgi:hypothetical protein
VIRRIVEHNRLNGVVFSTIEFVLAAAAAAFIAFGLGLHHQIFGVVLACGTGVNSLVIVCFGAFAWCRGERGTPLTRVFSPAGRAELTHEHPALMADTLIVAAATLIPFLLSAVVAAEFSRKVLEPGSASGTR